MVEHKYPPILDIRQAAEAARRLSGQNKLSDFERLLAESQGLGAENALAWSAQVERRQDDTGQSACWLRLTVEVSMPLICQRCLGRVDVAVQVEQEFRFVVNEEQAEQLDDESEEDLLVLSREFDLAGLIEDEVLLALPLVPRHEVCPSKPVLSAADADFESPQPSANPFAVLAGLKDKKTV